MFDGAIPASASDVQYRNPAHSEKPDRESVSTRLVVLPDEFVGEQVLWSVSSWILLEDSKGFHLTQTISPVGDDPAEAAGVASIDAILIKIGVR